MLVTYQPFLRYVYIVLIKIFFNFFQMFHISLSHFVLNLSKFCIFFWVLQSLSLSLIFFLFLSVCLFVCQLSLSLSLFSQLTLGGGFGGKLRPWILGGTGRLAAAAIAAVAVFGLLFATMIAYGTF